MKRIKLAKKIPSMNISERIFRIAIYATGLFLKKVLHFFVRNHLFIKNVSSSFRRFNHFDNLSISTTFFRSFVQTCYCFLCHGLYSFFII
ncbi:hypothetical protein BF2427 [Bacteroides fragilis YCH46]|uniref:Transmembrane protein n=1 Tax=Bacteroides fragilis (strain YCH46) TaxID=295405 RepID=Q64TK3_BACFR|nr:hypothetical protein BF2427 [Bacteroides fragilis YCH46]